MVKFLTVTTTAGRKELCPIHNYASIVALNNTTVKIAISPGSNSTSLDIMEITLSAADPLWVAKTSIQEGSMVDVLQKLIIEASSRGSYTDPYFDITNRIPIPIDGIIPKST